jgi:hypothetical protein
VNPNVDKVELSKGLHVFRTHARCADHVGLTIATRPALRAHPSYAYDLALQKAIPLVIAYEVYTVKPQIVAPWVNNLVWKEEK